ncbi:MAG: phosphoenolpyruvate--protein phosphotransferase [Candidatus Hydrogenedentota bacterium]
MEIALHGIGVSPGIAIGPAKTFGLDSLEIPQYKVPDPESELERFKQAVKEAREDLVRLRDKTAKDAGEYNASIFDAHIMVLDDVTLHEEIAQRARDEAYNVEYILNDLINQQAAIMESIEDPSFRDRMGDILDVGRRILGRLLNTELESLEHLEQPAIIVAHELAPSDTAKIDLKNARGLIIDMGGPTSHTAILARAFAIPAVVGLKNACAHIHPGDTIILDGSAGQVFIRPGEETFARYQNRQEHEVEQLEALQAVQTSCETTCTMDGHEVPLMANIELPVEVTDKLKTRADGIGLYRTEYLFLNRTSLPTEEEQYTAYATVVEAMNPLPVTLRTLDLGGDKFASHIQLAEELNPQLGWRAVRFCLERPDIFKAQLRAILRASIHGNVQVMFPLISGLDELLRVKEVFNDVCADLQRRSVPFRKDIKLGCMIEVPSAVAVADHLARNCDFFSIGTNDLIQYSLAVDRVNEKIAHMYEPAHPAVLRMLQQTVAAAREAGIPCSICGEMAGAPLFTEVLVGLGMSSLSMSMVAIPKVRVEITSFRFSEAQDTAAKATRMGLAEDVRSYLQQRHENRHALHTYIQQYSRADDTAKVRTE